MKALALALALAVSLPVCADESMKKPKARTHAAGTPPPAHQQPSKEQIRKFNELQKKEQQQKGAK